MHGVSLIDLSLTFPDPPTPPEIPLDSTIRGIAKRFDKDTQRIILVAPTGSGKTVHLEQFVRTFPDRCFSYFLSDNYWAWRPSALLLSLCRQMAGYLGDSRFDYQDDGDYVPGDVEQLKAVFENLTEKVISTARSNKVPCYFVIDGLEWTFQGVPGERIIDLFPLRTNARGLYLLCSVNITSSEKLAFAFNNVEPHLFSRLETETLLADLQLAPTDIARVHSSSSGVPGYLAVMRQLCRENRDHLERVLSAPSEIEALLQIQWTASGVEQAADTRQALALVAFSLTPLGSVTLAEILGWDVAKVTMTLNSTGFIRGVETNLIQFYPELLRNIARTRLRGMRERSLTLLTQYYEGKSTSMEASLLLPEYYREAGNYPALVQLLVPEHLASVVRQHKDLSIVKRELRHATEMAKSQGDLMGLLRFGLASAQFNTFSNRPVGESEVEALVAMKNYDKALELAYSASLVPFRIRLLARIYSAMDHDGTTVPRQAVAELAQMVDGLHADLDSDDLMSIAIEVFPILPDEATSLIDRAKGQEEATSTIDLAVAVALIQSRDASGQNLAERIQDTELREFAILSSPWLSKLSAQGLLKKVEAVKSTKAKEYLMRQWCLQNRESPDTHVVLTAALDVTNADPDYKIPIRNLRQLSESLAHCDPNTRRELVQRFDIPNFTSLRTPAEERLRLEFNLAEAMRDISQAEAFTRFLDAYTEFQQQPLDADVVCYCLARTLVTLSRIDKLDTLHLASLVNRTLADQFLELLLTSAEHFEIYERTLRALALVDPNEALVQASQLNTSYRRDEGVRTVLEAYLRQDRLPVSINIIDQALDSIGDRGVRERTIREVVREASTTHKLADPGLRNYLTDCIDRISDPIVACEAIAQLIASLNEQSDGPRITAIYTKLLDVWEQIDVVWMRVELAFRQIPKIARGSQSIAEKFYELASDLRDTSPLANQIIGVMYYETLVMASRLADRLDLSRTESRATFDQLIAAIDMVPSRLLTLRLVAQLAMARLRKGDKATFDQLIREQVVANLRSAPHSILRDAIITDIALAIFEYSPEVARELLSTLPYSARNDAWATVAIHTLRNTKIGDPIAKEATNSTIDLAVANKILYILGNIERDESLSFVVESFTASLENPNSHFSEQQRLDILVKLEAIVDSRLPDINNITHLGYKVLCLARIERARRKSAKRSKGLIKKKHNEILAAARALHNVADRTLVLSCIAEEFRDIETELAVRAADEALKLANQIPNVKDRIARLEAIADTYAKLRQTDRATEAIRIAHELVGSLAGISQDTVLASVIQTAHQLDPDLAASLSEKIDNPDTRRSVDTKLVISELVKAPHKLDSHYTSYNDDEEVLLAAAQQMLTALVEGRGVVHPRHVIADWLCSLSLVTTGTAKAIVHWATETILTQSAQSEVDPKAREIIEFLVHDTDMLLDVGSNVAFLSSIPSKLRSTLPGLSTTKKLYRVGEREAAIRFISTWLQANAKEYVKICDPYFDAEQLWILQAIATDIEVKLVTTVSRFGTTKEKLQSTQRADRDWQKREKERVRAQIEDAWATLSIQAPPPTLLVLHGTVFGSDTEDEFHDRYITTVGGGLSIGTSLNGMGSKQFFISVLDAEDASHVEQVYLDEKLDIQKFFTKVIYFELV